MIKRTSASKTSKSSTASARAAVQATPAVKADDIPNPFKRYAVFVVVFIACVSGVGLCAYAFAPKEKPSNGPQIQVREGVDKDAVESMIARVRDLVAVDPQDVPAVASIQNIEEVRKQNPLVYRDAQQGDKVLLFKGILVVYSVSQDRVLVAMPLDLAQETQESAQAPSTEVQETPEVATIEVRNGSATPGLARVAGNKLKSAGMDVIAINDAANHEYTKTEIYNASGKALPKTIATLVETLGGEVVTDVPAEAKTKADILVIVNK